MDNDDSIVIVGVGCKFPGADNLDEFWRVLSEGENHVIEIPRERWKLDAFYDKDPDIPGKTYVRHAGLLKRFDEFDHKFFGINEVEAARMDPQQRYVLECVHMAMEDGGITKKDLNESKTGVYIGVMNDDYKGSTSDDLRDMNNYTVTGTAGSIVSSRVSYTYNLRGPSMTIDTACSSALVAIHVASQSLRSGECRSVICGGVNSILTPQTFVPLSKARMVSPTGQSKAFSDKADGYTRGEGCGIVILKTKKRAIDDGNKIWATIATACNQDGRTMSPITAPSGTQQLQLLQRLYSDQGVDPKDVSYIEAHGTGTPVGDPVEANTLGKFFAENLNDTCQGNVYLGSVKTNIGHLESAAGVAGLIKVLLMIEHGKIVPSLHFDKPNPNVDFAKYRLKIPHTISPWPCPAEGRGRLSCINSFGFGGTNSHAIIKQYQGNSCRKLLKPPEDEIIAISGNDITSLRKSLAHLKQNIHKAKYCIQDVSYTSTCRRDHYPYRVAIQVKTKEDAVRKCEEQMRELDSIQAVGFSKPNVVFVFCGVGTTWTGMCQDLLKRKGVFQDTVRRIDSILAPLAGWSILKTLEQGFDAQDPFKGHLAIFTCQVALATLWNHFGIPPDSIVGQSVGEVAAAHAAGILSLEDAVSVIYQRSAILAKATGGTMAVISNCHVSIVADVCEMFKGKVNIAVKSSSMACTLSGDADAVEQIIDILSKKCQDKLYVRRLDVKCAYHSHHMTAASEELEHKLSGLKGSQSNCTVISTVTGQMASGKDMVSPEYWKKNVREQVLFDQAITKAYVGKTFNVYLEIGPKPILRFHLGNIVGTKNATALPSINVKKEWGMMQLSIMELYRHGLTPNWSHIVSYGNLTDIPRQFFNPVKMLFRSDVTALKNAGVKSTGQRHLFVEQVVNNGSGTIDFRINISPSETWFIYQHKVSGMITVPGALYTDVALEIGKSIFNNRTPEDFSIATEFVKPLLLQDGELCTAVAYAERFEDEISITIRKTNAIIAKCQITIVMANILDKVDVESIRARCKTHQTASQIYENLNAMGFSYGKDLKVLEDSVKSDDECLVRITVPDSVFKDTVCTHLHPSICDGIVQTIGVFYLKEDTGTMFLPGGIKHITVRRKPEKKMMVFTSLASDEKDRIQYNALLLTETGKVIAEVKHFFILRVGTTDIDEHAHLLQIQWEEIRRKDTKLTEMQSPDTPINSIVIARHLDKADVLSTAIKEMSFSYVSVQDTQNARILSNHLEKKEQAIQSVLFIVEKRENIDQMTGEEIMREVSENTSVFLKVCQCMVKIKKEIPLLVITEQTQSMGTVQNHVTNVLGSELWGMARTILLEYPLEITMIDRYVSLEMCSSVIKDILVFKSPQLCSETELLLRGNHVYANHFRGNQDQPGEYRWVYLNSSDHVQLKSYYPDDVQDTFCIEQNMEIEDSKLRLKVETAVMHDKNLYPLTLQAAEKDIPVWIDDNSDGFDIVTFEVSGEVMEPIKENPSQQDRMEGSYVACFPFILQSIVEVPENCLMRIDDFPDYKPGLLRMSALLWQIKDYIVNGKTLVIAAENGLSGGILRMMLSKSLRSQTTMINVKSLLHSPDKKGLKADNVVILTAVDFKTLDYILQTVEGFKKIVSIDMSVTQVDWKLRKHDPHAVTLICLNSENLLSRKSLSETVPMVVKWLRKNLTTIAHIKEGAENESILDLNKAKKENNRLKANRKQVLRRGGCYIIIGGLTGLGWEICEHIAQAGAGGIAILSRSTPNTHKLEQIQALERRTSTKIKSVSVDITDSISLLGAFAQIESEFPMLDVRGILHGGAVIDDAWFIKQNDSAFRKVLLPKVMGSWNLHIISRRYKLDFFIFHSSIASVFGNKGQTNYSAGNAFMDSLAHYRGARGLPGLSINWGPLSIGLATDKKRELELSGLFSIDIATIIDTFEMMLMSKCNQIGVVKVDWSLLESRVRKRFKKQLGDTHYQTSDIDSHHLTSSEAITNFVIEVASQVLAIDVDMINESTCVSQLGMDSMVAMTFVNTIRGRTGCTVPIVSLFGDETTIQDIANIVEKNVEETRNVHSREITSSTTHRASGKRPVPLRLFIYVDIKTTGDVSKIEAWKNILKCLFEKHPHLRTVFVNEDCETNNMEDSEANQMDDCETNKMYTKVVLPQDNIEPDVREVCKGTIKTDERIPSDLRMYAFDPGSELPLRLLYEKKEKSVLIRLVFSHLAFDLTSVILLLKEIQSFYNTESIMQPIATVHDAASLIESRLHSQNQSLKAFWKRQIPANIMPQSFSLSSVELDTEHFLTDSRQIPDRLLSNLKEFAKYNKISLFQLIVTAYQTLLGLALCTESVTVVTPVDIRIHFPELQNEMGCFINFVPLFLLLKEDSTLQSILRENVKHIRSAIDNSIYPLEFIKAEVASRITPDLVFRHLVNFRDLNIQQTYQHDGDGSGTVVNHVSLDHEFETVLVLWNDSQSGTMRLELQYNTLTVETTKADILLDSVITILDFFVDYKDFNVHAMVQTEGLRKLSEVIMTKRQEKLKSILDSKPTLEEQTSISGKYLALLNYIKQK
ncbi:phthioceranic/hydroxyphthioceranic acid synthase-like [Argopecten irradians]|uniref:phthioceranic/hydroxyphthioceranic acid synthase-like n=1 Tax=Argopecten irradians TaxID=31199 RepID=UPI003724401E